MKALILARALFAAVSVRAQLPVASPAVAGFDPARVEVMQATVNGSWTKASPRASSQ